MSDALSIGDFSVITHLSIKTLRYYHQVGLLEPAEVKILRENGTVYLFGFSKQGLTITRQDKEVVFTTHMGNLAFTAKFNPREMLYHGELAL